MNKQKIGTILAILLIPSLITLVVLLIIVLGDFGQPQTTKPSVPTVFVSLPLSSPLPSPPLALTKQFNHRNPNFAFLFPGNWLISPSSTGGGIFTLQDSQGHTVMIVEIKNEPLEGNLISITKTSLGDVWSLESSGESSQFIYQITLSEKTLVFKGYSHNNAYQEGLFKTIINSLDRAQNL